MNYFIVGSAMVLTACGGLVAILIYEIRNACQYCAHRITQHNIETGECWDCQSECKQYISKGWYIP